MKRHEGEHERAGAPGAYDDTIDAPTHARRGPLPPAATRWVVAERYEIQALLGSGGMGTVYRARDRELDEIVALKMVKKQIASKSGILERFRREVKLARRVTHRNVARTFDIGEHHGTKFLTMEFIAGEMLGAMLARRGRIRLGDVVRIGCDLCAGLAAAHAAGVLHRDLKPANVIIAPDGRAVITDFGIARAFSDGEAARTADGVVGTPAYMAPEQLEGASDLDARVDVYALGVMLFELLGGEVPWANEPPFKAALLRLREPPPDVRTLRPSLGEAPAELVRKCMATRREDRFAGADEVAAALTALVANESSPSLVPAAPARPAKAFVRTTIAVLPISNTGDTANDYLATSVTEDLADVLDDLPGLEVRAAPAIEVRPNGARDPLATGRACGVDAIIDGELRAHDQRIDVVFRLSTVEDGIVLWQGRFERPSSELVAVTDAAAAAIADALTTKALAPRPIPTNPLAFDLYLRGRHLLLGGFWDADGEANRLLGEAHMLAPGDATIAATYARELARGYGIEARGEDVARAAKTLAEKALLLQPRNADAHLALATLHRYRGEDVAAAAEIRRAFAVSPDDTDVLELLGRVRSEVGPLAQAIENLDAALAREPRRAEARGTLVRAWALLGEKQRAEDRLGEVPTSVNESVAYALTRLRLALWWREPANADDLAEAVAGFLPRERSVAKILMRASSRKPLDEGERATLVDLFQSGSTTTERLAAFHAQLRAEVFIATGDVDAAFEAVRDADANGLIDLMWLERCPLLDDLRGDRELAAIRRSTAVRAARVSAVLNSA